MFISQRSNPPREQDFSTSSPANTPPANTSPSSSSSSPSSSPSYASPSSRLKSVGQPVPLAVATVAARLGVAASTLRTWDRRYGLGPTLHRTGEHRKYGPTDVARLEYMRRLTSDGVAPGDAARVALAKYPSDAPTSAVGVAEDPLEAGLMIDPLTLAAASVEPDQPKAEAIIARGIGDLGIMRMWSELVKPAMEMVSKREKTDRPGVNPETVLTAALLNNLAKAFASQPGKGERRAEVVIVTAPEIQIRAHVLGAALGGNSIPTRLYQVTKSTSAAEILEEAGRLGARIIAVAGCVKQIGEIARVASQSERFDTFLIGRHAPDALLPRVHRARTTMAAIAEITEVAHPQSGH